MPGHSPVTTTVAASALGGKRNAATATLFLLLPAMLLLAGSFLLPLIRLIGLSLSSPAGRLAPYVELLGNDVYRKVFFNTFAFALMVTLVALVLAFPLALALTRLGGRAKALLFAAVLLPLWISVLVRTFAWMLLLEKNGPVNRLLIGSGMIDQPLALLFNHIGVLIGMVHVLLPYAVLPIYAALVRIDPALLRASEGLGATRFTTFRRVLLPQARGGVATAASFVFLLSLGFFITPALLGGARDITLSMLIDGFVEEQLVWPLAGAASVVLLVATLAVLALAGRAISAARLAEAA
jgi:ABC-type spermidine/putrescine transport system permease subunit I